MLLCKVDSVAEAFNGGLVRSEFDAVQTKFGFSLVAEVFSDMSTLNDWDAISGYTGTHFAFIN